MEFLELVKKRRSIRDYRKDPVSDEDIKAVLEAARLAPSWGNRQCWRFVVVKDEVTREKLADKREWIAEAPVVIVACADPGKSGQKADQDYYLLDVGIAMEHIMLAATERGLATCWIGWFDEDMARQAIGAPESIRVVAYTPLGHPAEEKDEVSERLPLEELVYYEKYGQR
ncbi:MAG: hypothetical protein AMS15_00925 [Planctomycetes bacterium DG_23]|nr:MAG: hypothetical protein AMS15_00925 [Planctomycetes bacterium DG_23]